MFSILEQELTFVQVDELQNQQTYYIAFNNQPVRDVIIEKMHINDVAEKACGQHSAG